nr:RRP12-like protein [Tanacetum cinerariifolium]
ISSTSSPHKSSSRSFSRLSFEDSYDDFDFLGPFVMDEDELMDLGDPARLLSLIEKLPSADPAVKLLLEMLVNKRVLEVVKEVMPEEHMKLITNIRKLVLMSRSLKIDSEDVGFNSDIQEKIQGDIQEKIQGAEGDPFS